jgi:hypothetical protein
MQADQPTASKNGKTLILFRKFELFEQQRAVELRLW